ncbi:hypothetical protein MELB17_14521 [Marinobacter sp. ELB17]|nr:hypothetical protein MELB17_14521 [Marinobacter sp. ELB17]
MTYQLKGSAAFIDTRVNSAAAKVRYYPVQCLLAR